MRGIATILLLMQDNPLEAWQQLSDHYREMGDEELRELAANFVDLTEVAQQVLRDEMRKRGLGFAAAAGESRRACGSLRAQHWESPAINPRPEDRRAIADSDLPHDYTWKTLLCECDTQQKALQISETLKRGRH